MSFIKNKLSAFKEIINTWRRRAIILKYVPYTKTKLVQFGNSYGGYCLSEALLSDKKQRIVLSFGIGEDLSFSQDIMDKTNSRIFAFDPTPRSEKYVLHHPLSLSDSFVFFAYGLSNDNKKQVFYMPKVKEYVSCSTHKQEWVGNETILVDMHTFDWIVKDLGLKSIDILKMDIEGSEFDVMDEILSNGIPIETICMEVHDYLFKDGTAYPKLKGLMKLIGQNGYCLTKLSRSCNEMTLVKKHY